MDSLIPEIAKFVLDNLGAEGAALALAGLTALSAAMPILHKLADMTQTQVDNKIVDFLAEVLRWIPRIRTGK